MSLTINTSMTSAAQTMSVNGTSSSTEQTTVQKEDETSKTSVPYTATSSQGDTLEISSAGQAASSASSSSTTDLSSYNETQLKEMYENGEITLAEYQEALSELTE